ncbi:MAG: hypothetical protein J7L90_03700 [Dehalococcoidia bacterium]|nr:hypothetical protein [Dehalococcoidia bacterium]
MELDQLGAVDQEVVEEQEEELAEWEVAELGQAPVEVVSALNAETDYHTR